MVSVRKPLRGVLQFRNDVAVAQIAARVGRYAAWNCAATVQRDVHSRLKSGSSSVVERQLPKLDVAGSIPVSRSKVQKERLFFQPQTQVTSWVL